MNYSTTAEAIKMQLIPQQRCWYGYLTELTPILMVYLVLALYQISDQSLWVDEVLSVEIALSADSLKTIWLNSQCPLYFTLLRLWSKLAGTSEFALRMLSTLLGASAILVVYATALELLNRRVAAVAALLLATSPFFIWYSQEIRYINLMIATSLLATYSFLRAVTTDRLRWWLSYTGFSLLATFSFVSVIFLLMAHGVYLLSQASQRRFLRRWLLCHIATVALFGGWFVAQYWERVGPALARDPSLTRRSGEALQLTDLLATIPYTFFTLSTGFSIGPSVPELHMSRSLASLFNHAAAIVPVGVLFSALFLLGLARVREHKNAGMFVLWWLIVPILGTFMAATLTTFAAYNVRYVAMVLPAYLILLTMGILQVGRPYLGVVLIVAVLAVNALSLANYYFDDRYAREDARAASEYLQSRIRPGDVILAVGNTKALDFYYKGTLPMERIDPRRTTGAEIADHLYATIRAHRRLWLVEIRPWETDPTQSVKAKLDKLSHRRGQKGFPGVSVYTYQFSG